MASTLVGVMADYLEAEVLDHEMMKGAYTAPAATHLAISDADPTDDGSGLNEPAGAWYGRVQLNPGDFNVASLAARSIATANDATFASSTTTENGIGWWALMDAAAAGNMMFYGPFVKSSHAIQVANVAGAGSASFEVTGDITADLTVGELLFVMGSTANDANYTIRAGSAYSGGTGRTTINVDEAVSDATADGTLYLHDKQNITSGDVFEVPAGNMTLVIQSGLFSDAEAKVILDHIFGKATDTPPSNLYVGVSSADPTDDASGWTEPVTGYPGRASTAAGDWNAASGNPTEIDNANELAFGAATADLGSMTHVGIWDQDVDTGYAITGVTTGGAGAGDFDVSGDQTSKLEVGAKIRVRGSTGNDGVYTIRSGSSFGGGNTTINVEEAVGDATVDGTVDLLGNMRLHGALDAAKTVNNGNVLKFVANALAVRLG